MYVLVIHNTYQYKGGEDSVVEAEMALLRQHGHEVIEYRRHNDEIKSASRVGVAIDTFWSHRTLAEVSKLIADARPDLIHVHNTFPLISPSVYWAAGRAGVPVVQTLHNFRLLCPQAMLLREGKVCEDCLGRVPWRGVMHGCYRDSLAQTAILAGMTTGHRWLGTWRDLVTRYIALNEFCRAKFIEGGLPAEKLVVKPNFVDWDDSLRDVVLDGGAIKNGFLYVGRLSREKGIATLVRAVTLSDAGMSLRVVGTGPDSHCLEGIPGVTLLGSLPGEGVRGAMSEALALVMPSLWYENFPRTLVEAFACGLPVIASRLGAMATLVREGETGLLFEPGDAEDLAEKIRWASANPLKMAQMGLAARQEYEAKYTPEINYRQLMTIYDSAIEDVKAVCRTGYASLP